MVHPHYKRMMVYIASPYSFPDPVENSHIAIQAAERLEATGVITPVVPHLSLLWHLVAPHDVDFWYSYDLALLWVCDAILRLPGKSTGADNEVAFAEEHAIRIFDKEHRVIQWAVEQIGE